MTEFSAHDSTKLRNKRRKKAKTNPKFQLSCISGVCVCCFSIGCVIQWIEKQRSEETIAAGHSAVWSSIN